jgi:hypothetical protein
MIFVHSRANTNTTALRMRDMAVKCVCALGFFSPWSVCADYQLAPRREQVNKLFLPEDSHALGMARRSMSKSRNKQMRELFDSGFGMHHAGLLCNVVVMRHLMATGWVFYLFPKGMLRSDRNLVEQYFAEGLIKVPAFLFVGGIPNFPHP